MFSHFQLEIVVWLFLALAIILIFRQHKSWSLALGASLTVAFGFGVIDPIGLIIVGLGLFLAFKGAKISGWKSHLIHIFIIFWALALATHQLPGFNNLLILDNVSSGSASRPFSLFINIDKPLITFAFLLLLPQILKHSSNSNRQSLRFIQFAILGLLFIPFIAWSGGLLKPELSIPNWLLLFAFNNLFMTCVAEEVFFRGYLQNRLERWGWVNALVISSILFALAHFAAGWLYMVLASLAGICYGLIYRATGKLYWAILAHFIFNLYHLLFFTYPLAK